MHLRLYDVGLRGMELLGQRTLDFNDTAMLETLSPWPMVFTNVSLIANRETPLHRDLCLQANWFDLLVNVGDHNGCVLSLPSLGVELAYNPGTECLLNCNHHHHPWENPPPPPKHTCSSSSPCSICLSEVGKRYHAFLKGTFKAHFAPPAISHHILQYLAKSPPTWTWTTRAGPRAGKLFQVPSVPTACSRDSPKVIQWIVTIFHAFKAQLAPQAISQETGRVLPGYVKLYQNNMLVHLRSQQAQLRARSKPTSPQTAKAPPHHQLSSTPTIADLLSQIEALRLDFKEFKHTHEASSSGESSSPSSSPEVAHTVLPNDPPSSPPSSTSSMSIVEESTAHPSHPWLQPIIDHRHSPVFIRRIDSSMTPTFSHAMPDDVQQVLTVGYPKASPRYLGVDSNGDLHISAQCPSEFVKMLINLTEDDPQPPLFHRSSTSRGVHWKPESLLLLPTPPPLCFIPLAPSEVCSALCVLTRVAAVTPLACAPQIWWQWAMWTDYLVRCSYVGTVLLVWCDIGTYRSLMLLELI